MIVDELGELEMLVVMSRRAASEQVEDVLARHPQVLEVAVVGSPDDRLGHKVTAYVVANGTTAEALDAHCLSSTLARFKRPREYRFVDELPKSASGKILRRMLRVEDTTV